VADPIAAARAGKLAPVYVLHSSHPVLLARAVAAIRDAAVPESARGFNYDVFEGRGTTASHILAAAQTLPMMAKRRMIFVRDLAAMNTAELAKLIPYLSSPNPTTTLLLVSSKVDKRLKFYAAAGRKKMLHELAAPRDVEPWVRDEAEALGIRIEPRAVSRLLDVVGKDLSRLSLSLEQLALYAMDRPIAADDVDDLIAETRERTVFELTNSIGAADLRGALTAVASLCDQRQSAVGVVVMLGRFMRQLALCHAGQAQRLPKGAMAKLVGVPPFLVGKIKGQASRYSAASVAAAITRISTADRALKGQTDIGKTLGRQLTERVLLDRLVTDIVQMAR
jgi:DNA polymerase-3 subunit delta